MNIGHKLIMLGLAFSLFGGTCAFAKPAPHFKNEGLSREERTVVSHVPTARRSGATGYAASPDKDGWPANMILG
jgi:hypothetical protein